MASCNRQSGVDVVDRERDAVHADLVGQRRRRLDGVGVDVLEKLDTAEAVQGLQHCDLGVVAVETDGGVRPLTVTVSRPGTVRPSSVKKSIVASMSRTAMPTFSSLMLIR